MEFVEVHRAVVVAVDLIEADLTFLRGQVLIQRLHEADELPEREAAVALEVIGIEALAPPAALPMD